MIKYFKELLKTLKSIDANLAKIANNTEKLSECVKYDRHSHGDKFSISTKHWND